VISSFGKENRPSASRAIALCAAAVKMKVPLDPPVSKRIIQSAEGVEGVVCRIVAAQICVFKWLRILLRFGIHTPLRSLGLTRAELQVVIIRRS
jgi:hypothetical protein